MPLATTILQFDFILLNILYFRGKDEWFKQICSSRNWCLYVAFTLDLEITTVDSISEKLKEDLKSVTENSSSFS